MVRERLENIMQEIAENRGLELCGLEVMSDHIHLFVSSPPQNGPSLLANWFKGISSRVYNHRHTDDRIRWTNAYHVGTAGTVSKVTIQEYIEEQTRCRDTSVELEE